jgi:hypothetical protein
MIIQDKMEAGPATVAVAAGKNRIPDPKTAVIVNAIA